MNFENNMRLACAFVGVAFAFPSFANVENPLSEPADVVARSIFFGDDKHSFSHLTDDEMEQTRGAALPIVITTAAWTVGGGVLNAGLHRYSTGSWNGGWRAFGAGAAAGFYASPIPVRAFGGFGSYAAGAVAGGVVMNPLLYQVDSKR